MRRALLALPAALLLALAPGTALATTGTSPEAGPTSDTAYARVGHLVPGLGAMRMSATLTSFAGAEPMTLTQSASYGTVGPYLPLPPGTYAVAVTPAGAPEDAPPVLTGTVTAEAGDAYTVLGLGTPTSARLQAVNDDISAPAPGAAKVRVINASSVGEVASVAVPGGPTLAAEAKFSEPSGYTDIPAGELAVQASAGPRSGSGDLAAAANSVYTLLVLDDGAGGLQLRSVQDATGAGQVPTGGAATGGGFLAGEGASRDGVALAAGSALLGAAAVGGGVLALRRRQPAA